MLRILMGARLAACFQGQKRWPGCCSKAFAVQAHRLRCCASGCCVEVRAGMTSAAMMADLELSQQVKCARISKSQAHPPLATMLAPSTSGTQSWWKTRRMRMAKST